MIERSPTPPVLRFDPKDHRYFLGDRELPSVTTVLTESFPLSIRKDLLETARWRGTVVHRACELDDKLELDESSIDDEVRPYLTAWRSFRRHTGFRPDLEGIEVQKYHPLLYYAGTIDRIGRDSRDRRILLDIKTGGRFPQYRLQL